MESQPDRSGQVASHRVARLTAAVFRLIPGFIDMRVSGNKIDALRTHRFSAGLLAGKLHERIARSGPEAPNLLLRNLSKREIPSLYGLRGIAALIVVIYHYCLTWKVCDFPGYYSVTLFFELSGLLITWLLLKEIDTSRRIDKKRFYLRRALRLFPVFYAVWILCRIAGSFAGSWAYFFYLGDYYTAIRQNYSMMTSAWSLGVEEKFYLLWPQFLGRLGLPKLTKILALILVIEPLYRWGLVCAGYRNYTNFAFDTSLDPIVVGCLIGILVKRGWSPPRWMLHPATLVSMSLIACILWKTSEIMIFALALLLIYVVCKPPRLLNNPVSRFMGVISYSLYLCHGYSADVIWPLLTGRGHPFSWFYGIPLQILLSIAVATALHFTIERPFLRLKERFHV
jgi:peptidoglycan/LPS O-acetylase OafA/YrhL